MTYFYITNYIGIQRAHFIFIKFESSIKKYTIFVKKSITKWKRKVFTVIKYTGHVTNLIWFFCWHYYETNADGIDIIYRFVDMIFGGEDPNPLTSQKKPIKSKKLLTTCSYPQWQKRQILPMFRNSLQRLLRHYLTGWQIAGVVGYKNRPQHSSKVSINLNIYIIKVMILKTVHGEWNNSKKY